MNRNLIVLSLAAALASASQPAAAVSASLVADIDPRFQSAGSQPENFVQVGNRVLFRLFLAGSGSQIWATQGAGEPTPLGPTGFGPMKAALGRAFFVGCPDEQCGLWASDGTPEGTRRLAASSQRFQFGVEVIQPPGSDRVYFGFDDGPHGYELWRSDGTPAGTRLVVDLRPGSLQSAARCFVWFRGRLYFVADTANGSAALFTSDGTRTGTRRVGSVRNVHQLAVIGGRLAFFTYPDQGGIELWSSDGSPAGTRKIKDLPPSFDEPTSIVAVGGRGFFSTVPDGKLWVTDGSPAGTWSLARSGFNNLYIVALGLRVAFMNGGELWSSDGTVAGTRKVKEICPGECNGVIVLGPAAMGRIWFVGFDPAKGREVWTSDLTPGGTRLLRESCPGDCGDPEIGFLAAGQRMYFTTGQYESRRLWSSDGTPAGTRVVAPLPRTTGSPLAGATLGAGSIVFAGSSAEHGSEPWISDGTPAGTREIADLFSDNLLGSDPLPIGSAGGRGYFYATDEEHGSELWSTDGTEEGTRLAFDSNPGPGHGSTGGRPWADAAGRLVLSNLGGSLLGTDGTPAGSEYILPPNVVARSVYESVAGRLLFVGVDPSHGAELWSTDGTLFGTQRLTDLAPPEPFRPEGVSPRLIVLRDRLVVPVLSPAGGEELLISDGTPAGTKPLADVYPFLVEPLREASGDPVDLGGQILFVTGENSDADTTIWRTDLTAAGTAPVGALDPSDLDATESASFALDGKMLVFGRSTAGEMLWVSDGTAAGTRSVEPVQFQRSVEPVVADGRLFFAGASGDLWTTDGTEAGTDRVLDESGTSFSVTSLVALGEVVAFVDNFRDEIRETDGTPAGTRRITLPPSVRVDDPRLVSFGAKALFAASDPVHGFELWALEP
ncbi:MAG: hypothetical protein ABJC13_19220 [Acidobacteriota bacterium]